MGAPAARVGDLTATGDPITGPGVANVVIGGQPAAVAGDTVNGPACVGAVAMGSTTVTIGGRPAAQVGSQVTGSHPQSGSPVTTAVAPPGATTVLIG